ncbi:MAG: protein O-mannosyl-transferase family [Anaerolineae bacterium]
MNRNVANRLLPWLVIALAGALYLATLDRGLRPDELTGGDLITHQYAQAQARPGNAPGYPLYTMLGWLWFRAGRALLGRALNPVQVLSLYSTLWGLASLWVLYHLLARREVTGGNHLLAALLTLFYAVTYFFWYYSVTTEQYTSAIFQTLLLVWLAFEWEARPGDRTLLAMAFVGGTMLANMLTTLFILPPLLYLIFTRRPDLLRRGRQVASAVGAGFLPLLSYAYVYIRGAQHPEWRGAGTWASTADWFIQFLGTRQGRDELLPGLTLHNLVTPEYPALMWGELTWLALAGGLIGWALLGRRKAGFFYGTLAIYLAFTTAYRFGNWFQVILPLYPLLVLGFGRSVARLWERSPARRAARALIALSLLLLIGYRAVASERELRLHGHNTPADTGLAPGRAVLADVESPGWEISSAFEEWVALQYLMTIWRAEPAVRPVDPGAPAEYGPRRAAAAFQNLVGPVSVHPAAVGANLIRLRPDPLTVLPPDARPVRLDFGGQMELRGARLERGGALATLYWTAPAPIAGDYTVSVRLWQNGQPIEGDGGPLIQDHRPVWNTYPTSRWRPGELIADAYTFSLPPAAHPDRIQVVVYRQTPDGFENLGEGMVDK